MVYLSHLLTLFTECRSCNQHCKGEVANQMGTFISIKQECHHCGHTWKWNSQPFINDVPAGNILLSAAILFSGSTPTKSLHLLKCLQVACISERTFHHHQTKYLAPSIIRYRSDTTSHTLDIFRRVTSASRARVEQTYFST